MAVSTPPPVASIRTEVRQVAPKLIDRGVLTFREVACHGSRIELPLVRRASRSRCARAASASG